MLRHDKNNKMMPKPLSDIFVYGLFDPATDELRYIGETKDGMARFKAHFAKSSWGKRDSHTRRWIAQLMDQGLRPNWVVLKYCNSKEEAGAEEARLVEHYRNAGFNLTNSKDGGLSGNCPTDEVKAKQSAAKKGKKQTPEVIAARVAGLIGRGQSPEHTAKVMATKAAWTDEQRKAIGRKIGASNQGRRMSQESIAKISATKKGVPSPQKGRKRTPEQNARNAAAQTGKKQSPEMVAKRVASSLATKAAKKDARIAAGLSPNTPISAETRLRMSEAKKGKKQSAESIEKRAAAIRGRKKTPNAVANQRKALLDGIAANKAAGGSAYRGTKNKIGVDE